MPRLKLTKHRAKRAVTAIPAAIFLCFVFGILLFTCVRSDVIEDTVDSTELSAESLTALTDNFEVTLQDDIYRKNTFINLDGLTTNVLGINSLNEVQKLEDGHLTDFDGTNDIPDFSSNIVELNNFLDERDIDFVYILAPHKRAFYDADFAPGYSSTLKDAQDAMIAALDDAGVTAIDMNTWYEENGWTMDDVYFKTDHHWLPQAALAAARVTMDVLDEQGLVNYDKALLTDESWNVTVLEDWLLGSYGKRVGEYYAGVDDMPVYFPTFDTDYSLSRLTGDTTDWSYTDSLLDLGYLNRKSYFRSDPVCIYLWADNPLQITTNPHAPTKSRVLIMGDSFTREWQYFLSTQFSEVYKIDTRYYSEGTLAQYVEEIQPDMVLMCTASITNKDLYTFGVSDYVASLHATEKNTAPLDIGDVSVEAADDEENSTTIEANLEAGQTYTLTLNSTTSIGSDDLYVQMTLQDVSTDAAIYNRYFDTNSGDTQKWIFTVPEEDDDDTYALYLYAGTKGHTAGVSTKVTDVTLYEGINEG